MLAPTLLKVPILQGRQLVELIAPGPAELAVFVGQNLHVSDCIEAKEPAKHGRESINVVGPEEYPDTLSIANVIDPLVAIGETDELRRYPPPNCVELVFEPRKIHKAS